MFLALSWGSFTRSSIPRIGPTGTLAASRISTASSAVRSMVHFSISGFNVSSCSFLKLFSAYSGTSSRSSLSMALANLVKRPLLAQAMATYPSFVRNVLNGAEPRLALPFLVGASPVKVFVTTKFSKTENAVSIIATSINCPSPVSSLWWTAAMIANAIWIPARASATDGPTL